MDQEHNPLSQQELNTWGDKIPFYCIALIWIAGTIYGLIELLAWIEAANPSLFSSTTQSATLVIILPIIGLSLTFLAIFLASLKYLFKHHYNKH